MPHHVCLFCCYYWHLSLLCCVIQLIILASVSLELCINITTIEHICSEKNENPLTGVQLSWMDQISFLSMFSLLQMLLANSSQ